MLDAAPAAAGSRGSSPAPRVGLKRPPQAASLASLQAFPAAGRGGPVAGRGRTLAARVGVPAGRGGMAAGRGGPAAAHLMAMDGHPTASHPARSQDIAGQCPPSSATRKRAAPAKKKDELGDQMDWTDANVSLACELMAEQVARGNRPNTHLNSVGYTEVSDKFFQMTGILLSKTQIKNKWDKLRVDWTIWLKLKRSQTGTGWNNATKTIDMETEWWKKAKKKKFQVVASLGKSLSKMRISSGKCLEILQMRKQIIGTL